MGLENNKLDELRDRNPFRVPEGYFENFTENMMSSLPDKPEVQIEKVSLLVRMKPLMYMAAAFAGLMIFFNVFNKTMGISADENSEVAMENTSSILSSDVSEEEYDADFFEYVSDIYAEKYAISYIYDFMED